MKINCAHKELVDIVQLQPNPKNPNTHPEKQIALLAKIIEYQGQRSPIVVSLRSGFITKGHGRLEAIKKLGWEKAAVDYQEYESEAQEYADMVADNKIAELADHDDAKMIDDLTKFDWIEDFDLSLLGMPDFKMPEKFEAQSDEDEIPGISTSEVKTKPGDVYRLGSHRLMCGDSTNIQHVETLMDGKKADITFSSPPYNVGKTPNGNDQKYLNDSDNKDDNEFADFLTSFTSCAMAASHFVFVNIQSLSGNKVALIEYLHRMKDVYADTIIWDKMTAEPAMAKNVLNSRFEYIHIFSQKANRVVGTKEFRGTLENIFQFNSRKDKDYAAVHKATFPVGFAEYFVENFATESVLDLFGGSGTTMIAAEKVRKKSYLMELDPYYCDIIVARWEKYTGHKAELLNG